MADQAQNSRVDSCSVLITLRHIPRYLPRTDDTKEETVYCISVLATDGMIGL